MVLQAYRKELLFATVEATVMDRVGKAYEKRIEGPRKKILAALAKDDFNEAYLLLNEINLRGVVSDQAKLLEFQFISAILTGANQLTSMEKTTFMDPNSQEHAPTFARTAVFILTWSIEQVLRDRLQDSIGFIITRSEQAHRTGEEPDFSKEDTDLSQGPLELSRIFPISDQCDHNHGNLQLISKQDPVALAQQMNAALAAGRGVVNLNGNLITSRLSSYGYLAEARATGVTTYQISEVLDDRTCPVCQRMHGRVFKVTKPYVRIQTMLGTTDPGALKQLAPWPKTDAASLSFLEDARADDLQDLGWDTPPFHPLCRGILVKSGEVRRASFTPALVRASRGRSAKRHFDQFDDPSQGDKDVLNLFDRETGEQILSKINELKGASTTEDLFFDKVSQRWSPRRRAYQDAVMEQVIRNSIKKAGGSIDDTLDIFLPAAGEKAEYIILGGRGGSGKSWFSKDGNLFDTKKYLVIDADEIKLAMGKVIPGFEDFDLFDGGRAFLWHEESSVIFERMTKIAHSRGINLVHDMTIKSGVQVIKRAVQAKALGYKIRALYMHLPRLEAAKRAITRFQAWAKVDPKTGKFIRHKLRAGQKPKDNWFLDKKTGKYFEKSLPFSKGGQPTYQGRFVPPHVVMANKLNELNFDRLKAFADDWVMYDNNVAFGVDPKLVAAKGAAADNLNRAATDLLFGKKSPFGEKYNALFKALPLSLKNEVTNSIIQTAAKGTIKDFRWSRGFDKLVFGTGASRGKVLDSVVAQFKGSTKPRLKAFAQVLGDKLQQSEVMVSRLNPRGKDIVIDVVAVETAGFSSVQQVEAYWQRLFRASQQSPNPITGEGLITGYHRIVTPDGREGLRLMIPQGLAQLAHINNNRPGGLRAALTQVIKDGKVDADIWFDRADIIIAKNDWEAQTNGQGFLEGFKEIFGPDAGTRRDSIRKEFAEILGAIFKRAERKARAGLLSGKWSFNPPPGVGGLGS